MDHNERTGHHRFTGAIPAVNLPSVDLALADLADANIRDADARDVGHYFRTILRLTTDDPRRGVSIR